MWVAAVAFLMLVSVAAPGRGQTPQPFPRPGSPPPPPPSPVTAVPRAQPPAAPSTAQPVPQPPANPGAPTTEALGFPIHPGAQFLASYDAGRGQRYYIFGSTTSFAEIVAFYRTQLDERGNLIFKEPPTHMFEIGRFRDETMAFPPGVTVKDWTWGGSQGYPNPTPGGQPARYPTIIMIVPAPPAVATPR